MKIAMADNCGGKFSKDIKNYWEKAGHEVKFERGVSEFLAQWADLYYMDWWDNNIHYLWKLYNGDEDHNRPENWDNSKKPRVCVRAIDWEVWVGLARDQRIIDWVDDCIVIAPHIEKKLRSNNEWGDKIHLIRPGVNLEKFTSKKKKTDGLQVGMVLGDMWWYKNHMGGLDIFTELYRYNKNWKLHIRGQHESGDYNPVMFQHYLESRGIQDAVTLYPPVDDMNEWYENIDVLLHTGMKETFCYAVGEAMAKNIPVVVNEFYGATDIYPSSILYKTHSEAVTKLDSSLNEGWERKYIQKEYSVEKMMKQYDLLLGT